MNSAGGVTSTPLALLSVSSVHMCGACSETTPGAQFSALSKMLKIIRGNGPAETPAKWQTCNNMAHSEVNRKMPGLSGAEKTSQ